MRRPFAAIPVHSLILAIAVLGACGGNGTDARPDITLSVSTTLLEDLPAIGTPRTLDVATWNLEWFGDRANGPEDEELQLANVAYFLGGLAVDLWAVQEVTSATQFDTLVARLDGYAGLLANDPAVVDGPRYYSDFNDNEQKVGLVYRSDRLSIDSARVILGEYDHAFAGRPPLLVHFTLHGLLAPASRLVVITLHAKAGADADDRARRETGAEALKAYLDARYPDRSVLVIGDFNDDVDTSIASGPSPYATFVDDPDYRFISEVLSEAAQSSTVFFPDMIDHHLASDELADVYVDGSVAVFPAGEYVGSYPETTSDHFPVSARYGTEVVALADGPLGRSSLRWSGAATDHVDLYRDGALLLTTGNDGRYLDELPVQPGTTVTYRVCEPATDRCSPEETATF